MRRDHVFTILLLVVAFPAGGKAQTSMEGGARAAALGGAATALSEDPWGDANPAAWATLAGRTIAFFAAEAFGLPELRTAAVAFAQPTAVGTFAAGARTFGFDAYRETRLRAGYAHGFRLGTTRRFNAGLSLRYTHVSIETYGNGSALEIGLGGLTRVFPSLLFGFQASNLFASRLSGREELPRTLALGMAYSPAEAVLLVLDAVKDVRFPLSFRAGLELRPATVIRLRTGFTTAPARHSVGAGFRLGRLAANFAAERHAALGWSPAASISLQW